MSEKRERLAAEALEELIEKAASKDWRAAAWLLDRRMDEEPDTGEDGVDELARKRAKRRAS